LQGIASREQSTVAPQALVMLNDERVRNIATSFAALARPNAETSIDQTVEAAYRLALGRPASDSEKQAMQAFIEQQKVMRGGDASAENLAVRDFCHLLLCTNEFIYVD